MSQSSITQIEHAVQIANQWLNELNQLMAWDDKPRSWRLLRAVLHATRDWLQINEAAQLAAELPVLVRGLYYEGWRPASVPAKPRTLAEFRARIAESFEKDPPDDVDEYIIQVFRLLAAHVAPGEITDIRQAMPVEIRRLWERALA